MSIAVANKENNPKRNIMSAIFSYQALRFFLRMEKKERILLVMNKKIATAVTSSITVDTFKLRTLMEERIRKHIPKRLDEVLRI